MQASIHSIESFGTLDGPGIRTVVFFQGCPLRCLYCHNIDCAVKSKGKLLEVDELVVRVMKNKEYWGKEGGVTASGGEPTFQTGAITEFFKKLQDRQVNTAIDSCLVTTRENIDKLLPVVGYWMLSVKHMDEKTHKWLTGRNNKELLENIKYLDSKLTDNRLRIRFLVIPGITDAPEHLRKVAEFVKTLKRLDVLEILRYSEIGKYKWLEIYGKYELEGKTREATHEDVLKAVEEFKKYDLPIKF